MTKLCVICGEPFEPRTCQVTCSDDCRNERNRRNRLAWMLDKVHRGAEFINDIKMSTGCVVCGYDEHPAALDLHHLDPSEKAFGFGVDGRNRSHKTLLAEAAKCVVLCACCHRLYHRDVNSVVTAVNKVVEDRRTA